jgi:DNA-binding NarL/FixJ family response regulator
MVRSYKLGVNAYVVKPVDFHEFVNAIKELGVSGRSSMSRRRAA